MNNYIDAAAFRDMILCADAALHANMQKINELNVFPVPDGDTGTNMGLTLNNAVVELRKKSFSSIDAAADCVAKALLRGARGNSGVILSLLFRGISRRLKGLETAGPEEFSAAMNEGVDAAYKAVMKPAEGTILTVSRLASAAAAQAAGAGSDLETCLVCALKVGDQALEDTTNQNPVLKKAGVVDAGGMGYLVILKAMLASLRGEAAPDAPAAGSAEQPGEGRVFTAEKVEIPTVNIFDTVYIVNKKSFDIDLRPLRLYLDSIGDSLVISEDDEIFKVHVHTDIPAAALTESLKYGELVVADIENMRMQAEAQQRGEEPMTAQGAENYQVGKKTPEPEEPKEDPDELSFAAPGIPVPQRPRLRRGRDRRTDDEPLDRRHPARHRAHAGLHGLRAAEQQEHHHGRAAGRPAGGGARPQGHRRPDDDGAAGRVRDAVLQRRLRGRADRRQHDGRGPERAHRDGDLRRL